MKTTVFPRRTKSFLLVKLKFLPSETKSSSRWNKKFFLMKLKFSADETVVSCRKNKNTDRSKERKEKVSHELSLYYFPFSIRNYVLNLSSN